MKTYKEVNESAKSSMAIVGFNLKTGLTEIIQAFNFSNKKQARSILNSMKAQGSMELHGYTKLNVMSLGQYEKNQNDIASMK